MNAHVLWILSYELWKRDNMLDKSRILSMFFAGVFSKLNTQEHESS